MFEDDGKVTKTITVAGDYLRADDYTYSSDVMVEPWESSALRLTPGIDPEN